MPRNNQLGSNQHGEALNYPEDWVKILQDFRRKNLTREKMLSELQSEHKFTISLSTLQRQLTIHTRSTRNPKVDMQEVGARLMELVSEDPRRALGARTLKERLAAEDIHVNRDWITEFLKVLEPQVVASRRPGARRIHKTGLHSIGPDEEWSVDGHDKIAANMGIGVWGGVDKFSRKVISHFAVPNNRLGDVTLACFILMIQRAGGIPIRLVADKGSETGKIHAVQEVLRMRYAPELLIEELPAATHVKSTYNITVERQWRPLYQRCLANIVVFWEQNNGDYHEGNPLHKHLARFVWAKIVQIQLDKQAKISAQHTIRSQPQRYLPSGDKPDQFYRFPEKFGGEPCLIKIPAEDIELLVSAYVPENLFVFCDQQIHDAATIALNNEGLPPLTPKNGWAMFSQLLPIVTALIS